MDFISLQTPPTSLWQVSMETPEVSGMQQDGARVIRETSPSSVAGRRAAPRPWLGSYGGDSVGWSQGKAAICCLHTLGAVHYSSALALARIARSWLLAQVWEAAPCPAPLGQNSMERLALLYQGPTTLGVSMETSWNNTGRGCWVMVSTAGPIPPMGKRNGVIIKPY